MSFHIGAIFPRVFHRAFSTLKNICPCGLELPKPSHLIDVVRERNLRSFSETIKCAHIHSLYYRKFEKVCRLKSEFDLILPIIARELPDVVHVSHSSKTSFAPVRNPLIQLLGEDDTQLCESELLKIDSLLKGYIDDEIDDKKLTFEEFKSKRILSVESFKELPSIKELLKDDMFKLNNAYDFYCKQQYYRYEQSWRQQ